MQWGGAQGSVRLDKPRLSLQMRLARYAVSRVNGSVPTLRGPQARCYTKVTLFVCLLPYHAVTVKKNRRFS